MDLEVECLAKANKLTTGLILFLALVFLALAFWPYVKKEDASKQQKEAKIVVTDFTGAKISLAKPAERVVCLLESGLTGLYMLGAKEKVVGVNHYPYQSHIYPYYKALDERFAQKTLPDVGEGTVVDLEKIVALKPDLVIIWSGYPEVIKTLQDKGLNVFAVQLDNFSQIFTEIELLGKLMGKEERAQQLVAIGKKELAAIEKEVQAVPEEKMPSCYFTWAESKLDVAGGNSTGTQLLKLAGGKSVTAQVKQEHLKANLEQVHKWNPDVIISWYGPNVIPEKFYNDNQWSDLAAVQKKRVYQLPDAFSCDLWTLKYIYGVRCAAKYLHPEIFSYDLKEEKRRLFKALYGSEGEKVANVQI